MNSYQDLIPVFHPLLRNEKWHRSLANIIQDYLNNPNPTRITLHNLLSSTTLLIETYLKEAVQEYIGATLPPNKRYGLGLVHYAKTKGFIPESKRGGNCIFHLIYWFFEKPRNITHHSFTDFLLPTSLLIICSANYILNEIDHMKQDLTFYDAKRKIDFDPVLDTLSLSVEEIIKDDEIIVPQQLETYLHFPDKRTARYNLINEGNIWSVKIPTSNFSAGTYRYDLVGYDQQNNRFNISGANFVKVQTVES